MSDFSYTDRCLKCGAVYFPDDGEHCSPDPRCGWCCVEESDEVPLFMCEACEDYFCGRCLDDYGICPHCAKEMKHVQQN